MEFIKSNLINTTTQLSVDSNTSVAGNVFDRDLINQYISTGFNNDATTTTLTIAFSSTTTVDRIALMEHNLRGYTIYYDGATANTFNLTSTADTTVSDYSSNSETSQFWRTTQVNVTSVSIDMKTTQVANSEKALGLFIVSSLELDFDRIPSAKNYKPRLRPKQIEHRLSDGGTRINYVQDKWNATIKFEFITTSFRDSLRSIYDSHDAYNFVAFGTTTSWDRLLFETVWVGPFDFYRYSADAATAGFTGTIKLEETPI